MFHVYMIVVSKNSCCNQPPGPGQPVDRERPAGIVQVGSFNDEHGQDGDQSAHEADAKCLPSLNKVAGSCYCSLNEKKSTNIS